MVSGILYYGLNTEINGPDEHARCAEDRRNKPNTSVVKTGYPGITYYVAPGFWSFCSKVVWAG